MNPAIGSPPTLEWIAVGRLAIDESYQRATDGPKSRSLISTITRNWNWNYCQPLVVSRREDGGLFVIDGQHRLAAAINRGDVPHLPCVVITGQSQSEEAQSFVAMNTVRQKLSQSDIFNAMLAAGDQEAIATAALLDQTGWHQTRNNSMTKPGVLGCAPMIVKLVKVHGECPVRNTLTALREAYAETPVANTSTLIRAIVGIFAEGKAGEDPDALIETLGSCEPTGWEDEGQDARRASPSLSRIEAIREAMLDAYRATLIERRMAA